MNEYQLAWTLYAIGSFGCGLAAWLMFRRFGREWGHFFMITVWVLLLTPYAINKEEMIMAPALFMVVMDGISNGFETVKPIILLLLGLWLVGLVLSLIFQLLTRSSANAKASARATKTQKAKNAQAAQKSPKMQKSQLNRSLDSEEELARSELLAGEIPLRAER